MLLVQKILLKQIPRSIMDQSILPILGAAAAFFLKKSGW